MKMFRFALLACMLVGPVPSIAATTPPVLTARPSATAAGLPVGETRLANGAVAYRPASARDGPLPLVILLHGATHLPPNFLQAMEPTAEKRGVLLLAPQSVGRTWDWLEDMSKGEKALRGLDAGRLDESLRELFSRAAVDPSRIVLLGFSDGASYALSLGVSNPGLFSSVVALSPGGFDWPPQIDLNQRIFIAHGRSDPVLPFANASRIAERLKQYQANVRFHAFDGGHLMEGAAITAALDWTLATGRVQASLQP
jgi:predicted esterase